MPYLRLDSGLRLYYQQGGHNEAEMVIFVNGLTMDSSSWQPVEASFASHYATLCYDCRGQGQSDKPEQPYLPEDHVADLKALLAHCAPDTCHLVALSNGGLIAMLLAGEIGQEVIHSVTVIDSFVRVDPMLLSILDSWKAALEAGGPGLRFDVATPWVWGHSYLNQYREQLLSYREKAAEAETHAIANLIDGLRLSNVDARKSLRAYEGPLLAVVGQEDILTPLRYSHEIVEWSKYGVLVTVDRAGHASPVERPDAIVQIVQGFIERREEFMTPLWEQD